jgi:hypothetical protein
LQIGKKQKMFESRKGTKKYLESVVSPAAEFHVAVLVIKGKPSDVNLAGRLKNSGWNVSALPSVGHHHVRRVGAVKGLVGTDQLTDNE